LKSIKSMKLAVPWLCLCVVLQGATGSAPPQLSAFDDFMHGILAKWRIPGAALGVSLNGRLVLGRGYGVADDALFRIGGISRSIAAAAMLRLVEDGKLAADDPAFAILRSGLDQPGPANCDSPRAGTDDADAALAGTIEKASGQSYESFVKSAVLAPLGVSRMQIGPARNDGRVTEWLASVSDLLRFANALDGRRPPMFLTQHSLQTMIARPPAVSASAPCYAGVGWVIQPAGEDADWWSSGGSPDGGAYLLRQAATGVDVALLFNSRPAEIGAFGTEVSAGIVQTANSITQWPAVDQFASGPELFARDVVNGADYRGGGVAPGEYVILYPSNAGPPDMAPWGLEGHMGTAAPIGETRVFFGNAEAAVVYAVSGQVAAIVPDDVAGQKTTELVIEYQGRRSPPVSLPVTASAPAIFTLNASGKGQAAMLNETGCCNSVPNPAVRGTISSLFATGEGRITPALAARHISVTVGGVPAEVLYAGNGSSIQVNFRVPANAPVGDAVPVVLSVAGRRSTPLVTMAVRSARRSVLLIDNDAAARNRLTRILGGAGYQVLTAAKAQPDLAIVDLAMRGEGLLETIRTLRDADPQVKIIALSVDLGPDTLRTADILGSQAVLVKPLNAVTLLARVRTVLQRRPAAY
jgi:uncharacterized protein (TIGR03437 family)